MNTFPENWVKEIFARFNIRYRDKFSAYSGSPADKLAVLRDWQNALEGISYEQVKNGIDACFKTYTWPPNATEFLILCLAQEELPTAREAFRMAVRGDFKHKEVRLAFDAVGSWAFRNESEKYLKSEFIAEYNEIVRRISSRNSKKPLTASPVNLNIEELPIYQIDHKD